MEVAASAVALVQAVEICIRAARELIERIRAYRHANDLISDLVLRIEGIWAKTEIQVGALSRVSSYQNERLRDFHDDCLRTLVAKLNAAIADSDPFVNRETVGSSVSNLILDHSPWKRLRFSLLEKHLKRTIQSLEQWHAIFDPSWFLITLRTENNLTTALQGESASSQDQEELKVILDVRRAIRESKSQDKTLGSVFRDKSFVASSQVSLPFSDLVTTKLSQSDDEVIVNTTNYPRGTDLQPVLEHVRDLARVLSYSQPQTFGLLQCRGVIKELDNDGKVCQYQYIFAMPPNAASTPLSLRALLLEPCPSLNVKYGIAESITKGVLAVHCADFVHKNIRPDNVLVFGPHEPGVKAYLVGFERSRPVGPNTNLTGDMVWYRNLYRHPSRQGSKPEEAYIMQHDIYSLGVCLLEIGIWTSLVLPSGEPAPKLPLTQLLNNRNPKQAASDIKKVLIEMAQTLLPSLVGIAFADTVISCLTCLDSDATNMFANEKDLRDEEGILVGVVFIEKILARLNSFSI